MASHGRGAVGRWTFGSVADRVARSSPLPVLIVCPTEGGADPRHAEITRVVAPLDGSELSQRALPVAESAARRLRVPTMTGPASGWDWNGDAGQARLPFGRGGRHGAREGSLQS